MVGTDHSAINVNFKCDRKMCNKMILINFKHVPVNRGCVYFSMIVYTNGIRNVYNFEGYPIDPLQGVPEKNETHFQFLITLKLFDPYTCLYTSF